MRLLVILLFLGACSNMSYNKTVEKLDIDRFMGKWYVIAARYTIFEEGAHNSVEHYTWNEKENRIDVDFTYRKNSFDGKLKRITQKAWIHNKESNAHWKVQIIWPFKLDYIVVDIDENYEWVVVGVPSESYVWIMAREWKMSSEKLAQIKLRLDELGYSTKDISMIPQKWDES